MKRSINLYILTSLVSVACLTLTTVALPPFIGIGSFDRQSAGSASYILTWTPTITLAEWSPATNSPGDVATANVTPGIEDIDTFSCSVTNITALTIVGLQSLLFIDVSDNSLTSVNLTNCPALNEMYFNYNSLSVENVNRILHMISTNAVDGGVLYLDNQTPAAVPTTGPPDGLAAYNTLTNRGWTVVVDW